MSRSYNLLMISGMGRSGTTLLTQCLDFHPEIVVKNDPIGEFFKGYQAHVYRMVEKHIPSPQYPIDNYGFSGSTRVLDYMATHDLHEKIPSDIFSSILQRIYIRGSGYCPEIKEQVLKCKGTTFSKLYLELIELIANIYGCNNEKYIGTKEAWCEQFVLPLANTFPKMKFINIIRDPRGAIASNFNTNLKYPLLWNVRDWRKSVYYTYACNQLIENLERKFYFVRYEDLVNDPRKTLEEISSFLELPFSERMIEGKLKGKWSSYQDAPDKQGIFRNSLERWKKSLPKNLIYQIELLCHSEMQWLKYPFTVKNVSSIRLFFLSDIPICDWPAWCKDVFPSKTPFYQIWLLKNRTLELCRKLVIHYPILGNICRIKRMGLFDKDYLHFLNGFKKKAMKQTGRP